MSDNLPAIIGDDGTIVGLEDLDEGGVLIPRIKIDHKNAQFVDEASGDVEFTSRRVVFLGLVTHRVLWEPDVEEDSDGPLCRSYDGKVGYPTEKFPWDSTDFADKSETLGCEECPLSNWDTHPTRKTVPWCTKQLLLAGYMFPDHEDDDGSDLDINTWVPGLFTFQSSSAKNTETYLKGFRRARLPLFAHYTTVSLEGRTRGSVDYAVANFKRGRPVPQEMFGELADMYRETREVLQTPWTRKDDDAEEDEKPAPKSAARSAERSKAGTKPTSARRTTPAPAAKVQEAEVVEESSGDDDEEIPF